MLKAGIWVGRSDHETACSESVEGVDLGFEVCAGVARGSSAIVEASCEKEHGGAWVEFDLAGFQEGSKFVDLVLHAKTIEVVRGFALPCA